MENIRATKGRQKVEMKKVENLDARYVCFSKRRSGIFKKASDLSTLCGGEMLILIDSPAGRTHSFSHPSIDVLAHRFLGDLNFGLGSTRPGLNPNRGLLEVQQNAHIQRLTKSCEVFAELNDIQMKKKKALSERCKMLSAGPQGAILRSPDELKKLSIEELDKLAKQLGEFKNKLSARIGHVRREAETTRALGLTLKADPNQGVNTYHNEPINSSLDPSLLPLSINPYGIALNAAPISIGEPFSVIPTQLVNPSEQQQITNGIHNMDNPSFDEFNRIGDQNL